MIKNSIVPILGSRWEIQMKTKQDNDPILEDNNGYCDWTVRKIVLLKQEPHILNLKDMDAFTKKNLKHELIHAYLDEVGLKSSSTWARNEEMVDWFASTISKIEQTYKDILE